MVERTTRVAKPTRAPDSVVWAVVTRQKSLNELPPCVEALVTGRRHAEWPRRRCTVCSG
ncbi:hypothetical protein EMEDMD4_750016 [Sinorhizobium medicae]|uniref:Uncharacterized protein n=1 Tax=Sinorhizobium medicae TaxID=110321 RepID=A0A508X510_9HYPH|nr:hypothetical protein EMEDMD4_750016 [Sinorhizobium medicae]